MAKKSRKSKISLHEYAIDELAIPLLARVVREQFMNEKLIMSGDISIENDKDGIYLLCRRSPLSWMISDLSIAITAGYEVWCILNKSERP